jgi:hypothetical protein
VRNGYSTSAGAMRSPAPRVVVRMMRPTRFLILTLALLGAALVLAPVSQAASSKPCKRLVAKSKAKVSGKGRYALIAKRGSQSRLNLTYYACLYSKPSLYKLPGQNGGDTEFFSLFNASVRYLAYQHVNQEQAATFSPGWIEIVDLKRRKRVAQYDAFPVGPEDEETTNVAQILLQPDGAVAWIGRDFGAPDNFSVQTALLGQAQPAEVDRGPDVGPSSLRRGTRSTPTFSWTRAGVRKEAAYGGPSVMAP